MKRVYWYVKPDHASNGHIWEYGYWDGKLIIVRCNLCRKQPLELLHARGGFDPCLPCQNWSP